MLKKFKLIIIVCTMMFFGQTISYASSLTYEVKPIIPENQVNKSATYFDLKVLPGETQTLTVSINNTTDKTVKLSPVLNTAKTSYTGVIDYKNTKLKSDSTLPIDISDVIKPVEKMIEIPAHTSYDVKLNITMPNKRFNGQLLGGIVFNDENQETRDSGISNVYSYIVGIVLHGETEVSTDNLALGLVYPNQVNYRNVISSDLRNTSPKILSGLEVQSRVTAKGSDKILYSTTKKDQTLAPNSIFAYPTSLNDERLKPGKYTMHISAKTAKKSWTFNKDFVIKDSEAKNFNSIAVDLPKDYTWVYILVIGLLVIVIVVIALYSIYKQKHNKNKIK